MNFLSRISIKAKILVIPGVAVIGFIASLAVNNSINVDNTERLAYIQDIYFPVVQSSRENIVRINRTEELLNTAVSTGETDMLDQAKRTFGELTAKIEEQKKLWPEKEGILSETQKYAKDYFQVALKLSAGMVNGGLDPSEMPTLVKQMNEGLSKTKRQLTQFNESALQAFYKTVEDSNDAANNALVTGLALSGISKIGRASCRERV